MAITYYHGLIKDVDDNGDISVLYPKTYASDTEYNNSESGLTANNVQDAIDEIDADLTASDNTKFEFTKSGNDYGYKDSSGAFIPFKKVQASKTVTAGTSATTVTPDSGYDGVASVTVNPTPSETKSQAAGTSNIDVTPTSGKLLSKVTVSPTPSQTKSVTATTSAQTISPDSGKLLSSITVNPQQHVGMTGTPSECYRAQQYDAVDMGVVHNFRTFIPGPSRHWIFYNFYNLGFVGRPISRASGYPSSMILPKILHVPLDNAYNNQIDVTSVNYGCCLKVEFPDPGDSQWQGGTITSCAPIVKWGNSKIKYSLKVNFTLGAVPQYAQLRIGLTNDVITVASTGTIIASALVPITSNNALLTGEIDVSSVPWGTKCYPFVALDINQVSVGADMYIYYLISE